jgi:hypothetical protein
MLIELLKWLPYTFLGACIGWGAEEITGWKYGFLVGLAAWVYSECMTRREVARHVRMVCRLDAAEAAMKKQNEATNAEASGQKP